MPPNTSAIFDINGLFNLLSLGGPVVAVLVAMSVVGLAIRGSAGIHAKLRKNDFTPLFINGNPGIPYCPVGWWPSAAGPCLYYIQMLN